MKSTVGFRFIVYAILAAVVLMAPLSAAAAVPPVINYQGYLTDSSGNPLTTTVQISFLLFTSAVGGAPEWQETQDVDIVDGHYSVQLGEIVSLPPPLGFETPFYLAIQVGLDPEMTPRQELASVPYAFNADTLDGLDAADLAPVVHGHDHSALNDDEAGKHRLIDDGGSAATDLWSAQKIGTDLAGKADTAHGHDAAYVNVGEAASVSDAMLVDGAALAEIADDDGASSGLDADRLDGEEGAFYRDASNMSAGTLDDARLSANVAMQADLSSLQALIDTLQGQVEALDYKTGVEQVLDDSTLAARNPAVAVSDGGNAIAAWEQYDGAMYHIWAAYYTPLAGWATPQPIEGGLESASSPQVAISTAGHAIVVWEQSDGSHTSVWCHPYYYPDGWDGERLVDITATEDASMARVGVDADGGAFIVWEQTNGPSFDIWYNIYSISLGTFSGAALLESDDSGEARTPQVAVNPAGDAVASWHHSDGANDNAWARLYANGVGWGTAAPIEVLGGDAGETRAAISPGGDAVVVWGQFDGIRDHIYANVYTDGVGWGGEALVEFDDSGDAIYPRVAMNASGNAVAVWRQSDGSLFHVLSNTYTSGGGWGTEGPIESSMAGDVQNAEVAIDAAGNATALWQHHDGVRYNIMVNFYRPALGWRAPYLIESEDNGHAQNPRIAVNAGGMGIAVWQQDDGTRDNVWSKLFP